MKVTYKNSDEIIQPEVSLVGFRYRTYRCLVLYTTQTWSVPFIDQEIMLTLYL